MEILVRKCISFGFELHQPARGPAHACSRFDDRLDHGRQVCRIRQRSKGRCIVEGGTTVDAARGREFKGHAIVVLNRRAVAIPLQLAGPSEIQRHQLKARRHRPRVADIRQECRDGPEPEMPANTVETRFDGRAVGSDEKQVGGADQPHRPFRKHRGEGPHDRAEIGVADIVRVRPLTEKAVRFQTRARRLEKLPREQRGDAGHPGIGRF